MINEINIESSLDNKFLKGRYIITMGVNSTTKLEPI